MTGMSCSSVVMRANDRWGIGDKDCGGSERAAHAASTAEQILRKKVEGICKGNAANVDAASLLGSITTLHSDASTEGISSKRLPKRRKKPSHCFGTAIKKRSHQNAGGSAYLISPEHQSSTDCDMQILERSNCGCMTHGSIECTHHRTQAFFRHLCETHSAHL